MSNFYFKYVGKEKNGLEITANAQCSSNANLNTLNALIMQEKNQFITIRRIMAIHVELIFKTLPL